VQNTVLERVDTVVAPLLDDKSTSAAANDKKRVINADAMPDEKQELFHLRDNIVSPKLLPVHVRATPKSAPANVQKKRKTKGLAFISAYGDDSGPED
jgi:hypothetical protein